MYNHCSSTRVLHNRQIECRVSPRSPAIMRRSIFAMVPVYNKLHQNIVSANSVPIFQKRLQMELKEAAKNNVQDWDKIFHV